MRVTLQPLVNSGGAYDANIVGGRAALLTRFAGRGAAHFPAFQLQTTTKLTLFFAHPARQTATPASAYSQRARAFARAGRIADHG